jgi:hypothetical protein
MKTNSVLAAALLGATASEAAVHSMKLKKIPLSEQLVSQIEALYHAHTLMISRKPPTLADTHRLLARSTWAFDQRDTESRCSKTPPSRAMMTTQYPSATS